MRNRNHFILLLIVFLIYGCNKPADETGETLVQDDFLDTTFDGVGETDIFFIANNTLYGVRDNNEPKAIGVGSIDPFLELTITSNNPIQTTPFAFYKTNPYRSGDGDLAGDYRDIAMAITTPEGFLQIYDIPLDEQLWSTYLNGELKHAPTVAYLNDDNGLVNLMVGNASGNFYAINAVNGEIAWVFDSPNGAGFEAPTVSKNRVSGSDGFSVTVNQTVFAQTSDGWVYALDSATGALRWSYDTGGPISSKSNYLQDSFNLSDFEDSLLITRQDGTIIRLNTLGDLIYQRNTPQQAAIFSAATYSRFDESLLIPSANDKIISFTIFDGDINWESRRPASVNSSILEFEDKFYALDTEGTLFGFDIPSFGAEEWRTAVPNALFGIASTPNINGSFNFDERGIYVQNHRGIYGYNANGRLFSQFEINTSESQEDTTPNTSSPVVIRNRRTIYNPKNVDGF